MTSRLLILSLLFTCALAGGSVADLRVNLSNRSQPKSAPAAAARAAQKRSPTPADLRTPTAQRGSLTSRSMPGQIIGIHRRGGPPVLPGLDGVVEAPAPQPRAAEAPKMPVNARLGRMLAAETDIYRMPDPTSRWVGKVKRGQQVAVVSQWNGWFAVVMGDGSEAYVPQTHVELLPYQVKSVAPAPQPEPPAPAPAAYQSPAGSSSLVQAVIDEAFRYEGVRYVYGGNTERGIDCSGLVKNCFSVCGVPLPRRASEQATVGVAVPLDQLQAGDRLYFSVKRQFDHTGIYLGNGYFIHASASRKKVTVDHLSTPLFGKNLEAARRL